MINSKSAFKFSLVLIAGIAIGVGFMLVKNTGDNGKFMNSPDHSIYELQQRVWIYGDTNAYKELRWAYIDSEPAKNGMFWPLFMANHYGYPLAHWDVYFFIEYAYWSKYGDSAMYKMDTGMRKIALQYLKSGAERKQVDCINTLQELKEKGFRIE